MKKEDLLNYDLFQFLTKEEHEMYTYITNCLANEDSDPRDRSAYNGAIYYIIGKLYDFYSIDSISKIICHDLKVYDYDLKHTIDVYVDTILTSLFVGSCEYSLYEEYSNNKNVGHFPPQHFYTIASIFCKIHMITIINICI